MRIRPSEDSIRQRAVEEGEYVVELRATVREIASAFGVSKSTVHKDVAERLPKIRPHLAQKVRAVLDLNWDEKHVRGGRATQKKYGEAG